MSRARVAALAALVLVGSGPVRAQTVSAGATLTDAPIAAAAAPVADGARLRPGIRTYEVRAGADGALRPVGTHAVVVGDALVAGQAAWQVVERRTGAAGGVVVATDSVLLDRSSLEPRRWEGAAGGLRLATTFSNGTLYAGITGGAARRMVQAPSPAAVVTSEGSLDALLAAWGLDVGWSATVPQLVFDAGGARTVPLQIAVAGRETVSVPAGRYDALVIDVVAADAASEFGAIVSRRLWLEPQSGVVVRSVTRDAATGRTVERLLTR